MSRYDREAVFFDGLHEFDVQHPILSRIGAWLIGTVFLTVSLIGPLIGTFALDWTVGFDPNSSADTALAFLGPSALLSAVGCIAAEISDRLRRRRA